MEIYLVGGAVRDMLLGLEPRDRDYLVVGSTPEEMIKEGYTQVGGDFPVFLHPDTGEEYALARKEFKEGHGYQGFSVSFGPEVTLEEDLARRDLTINAMAYRDRLYDPYGGEKDLQEGILRPTSEAFSEDPVRVLRAARFLARHPGFTISPELDDAIAEVYLSGELDNLVFERVWLETVKALGEVKPSEFFRLLTPLGLFPELEDMIGLDEKNKWHPEADVFEHIMLGLDRPEADMDPLIRFGILCHDFGKPKAYEATGGLKSTRHEQLGISIVNAFCDRVKAPVRYRRFGLLCAEYHTHCHISFEMKPKTIHKLLSKFKDESHLTDFLKVAICDKKGRGQPACDWDYAQPKYLLACYKAMKGVDTKAISSSMEQGPRVGEAIRRVEVAAVASIDKSKYQEEV